MQRETTFSNLEKNHISVQACTFSGMNIFTYHLLSKFLVCSAKPYHHGHLHIEVSEGKDNAFSDHVAPRQTTKYVHEDGLDPLVRANRPEGRLDRFRGGLAAGIKEVSAVATVDRKCINCVHGETSSVDQSADTSFALKPVQVRTDMLSLWGKMVLKSLQLT